MDVENIYDVIVIGAGAAGLSAVLYARRAGFKTLLIDRYRMSQSQIVYSDNVDNYLGIPSVPGFKLLESFRNHSLDETVDIQELTVSDIVVDGKSIKVVSDKGRTFMGSSVVIATGAVHNKLNIPGEEQFAGHGVSYCAQCDGAFYKDKPVAVIGGGDTALSEALYLSEMCSRVYILHRRDKLRGSVSYQKRIFEKDNITFIGNVSLDRIVGRELVSGLEYIDKDECQSKYIEVSGVFVAIGMRPATEIVTRLLKIDEDGYIAAGEDGVTNIPGVFVAGDVRSKMFRQVITAVSDGANCIKSVELYLNR